MNTFRLILIFSFFSSPFIFCSEQPGRNLDLYKKFTMYGLVTAASNAVIIQISRKMSDKYGSFRKAFKSSRGCFDIGKLSVAGLVFGRCLNKTIDLYQEIHYQKKID